MTVVFTAGNIIYHSKRRVEITLRADVGRPLTIVAASDLHLGFGIGSRELARWIEIINLERPDAVLFAGDAIDSSTRPLWSGDYAAVLRRLDAPSGVFAVPGNHEYISGVEESLRFLEQAGVRVLRDSVAMIADGVAVVGRDDASNRGRATVASLTAGLPEGVATILLDHQPLDLDEAADAGIDLQISGHTHRGQLWPATWITDRLFERSHGALQKGSTNYYITQGLGIWGGKFRLGSRSEYLVIRVRRRE
jgi:predicted MPP superfamily phosphohydrolase